MLSRSRRITILVFSLVLLILVFPVYAATFVVSPGNLQGWVFVPCGGACTNGTIAPVFENGPGTPPLGTGSLFVDVASNSSKIIFGRQDYHLLPLSQLQTLTYSTYVESTSTNLLPFYLNIYIDLDGDLDHEARMDFSPQDNGTVVPGIWQTWDASLPTSVYFTQGGTTTLGAFMLANPTARVVNPFTGNQYPGITVNEGDTSTTYTGFQGNFDNITIAFSSVGSNTWDFDPTPPVPAPDITVDKLADTDGDDSFSDSETGTPGGFVRYQVTVNNVGDSSVTVTSLSDSPAHAFNETCASFVGTVIASGNSASCTFTSTLPNSYDASVTDTITVTAENSAFVSDSASDSTTVTTTGTIEIIVPACDDASNRTSTFSNTDKLNIGNDWVSGIRFCEFPFDEEDTIVSVQLRLTPSNVNFAFNMQIGFEDANDSQPFAALPANRRPSSRTIASAVIWNPGSWSANVPYLSPNLNNSLQEVFDRPGYNAGNDVAVIVRPLGNPSLHLAWSSEAANVSYRPVLIVRVPASEIP